MSLSPAGLPRQAEALLAAPADSVTAELAAITAPRARLEACAAALNELEELLAALRPLRRSMVYAGEDQFSVPQKFCRVRLGPDGQPAPEGQPCTAWPYHALGLCTHHGHQYRRQGVPWGPGGLCLPSKPARPEGVRWRAKALKITQLSHYLWLQMKEDRVYPDGHGGWTSDKSQQPAGTTGYWRRVSRGAGAVLELPAPPRRYATSDEHWAATAVIHQRAKAAEALADRIRWEIRDPTLRLLFPEVSSNLTLAEWAGVSEDVISGLRRGTRGEGSRASGRRRELAT